MKQIPAYKVESLKRELDKAKAQRDALLAAAEKGLEALKPLLPKTLELSQVNSGVRASEAMAAGQASIALRAAIQEAHR